MKGIGATIIPFITFIRVPIIRVFRVFRGSFFFVRRCVSSSLHVLRAQEL